ncbi:hemicentin-1-like, partial [Musca vetustissima]|uniref:hemicentin-1-like n=1 Tax=Musca vetustissima TaxID=27455 RepID=UPI002AB7BC12
MCLAYGQTSEMLGIDDMKERNKESHFNAKDVIELKQISGTYGEEDDILIKREHELIDNGMERNETLNDNEDEGNEIEMENITERGQNNNSEIVLALKSTTKRTATTTEISTRFATAAKTRPILFTSTPTPLQQQEHPEQQQRQPATPTSASTNSVELMGPWYIIGALLLLSARAGDSTNKIIPQQIGGHTNAANGATGMHHHIPKNSIATNVLNGGGNNNNKGTVLSGNGVIVAGGGSISPSSSLNTITEEPEFTEYIENVTVPAGRNIKLACSVKNLGSYKVAWMHFEQSAILTVHNHVITRNPRISVTHDKHDRHRSWYLHINNVQEEDKGRYMCQINTVTAKTQFGYLNVVVPPNIDDSLSSSDVIVRENSNISLRCKATGSPKPVIKWKRDDNSRITISKNHIVSEWEGDTLELTRISRLDMGAYLCIASNGVPPTVSKRIKVSVD